MVDRSTSSERRKLRGVLVGCGYASTFQLAAWRAIDGVEIAAVGDLVRNRAEIRAAQFGISSVYDDAETMLDDVSPDFVDIATPYESHLALTVLAAKRGIDVLCQKPMAGTRREVEEIVRLADSHRIAITINENARFQPWFRSLRSVLDQGRLGVIRRLRFETRAPLSRSPGGFGDQDYLESTARLVILDLGVHHLDTARFLLGEAQSVIGITDRVSESVAGEDLALIVLRHDQATVSIDMSWAHRRWDGLEHPATWSSVRIEGDRGAASISDSGTLDVWTEHGHEMITHPEHGVEEGYIAMQRHFLDCLLAGTEAETSARQTAKTMDLVFGAYESAASGEVYQGATQSTVDPDG